MHFILSGAYRKALRWRWVSVSPVAQAEPPDAPPPKPQPPTAEQAARIVNEAWRDADWGTFIWTAMTTGARRGEMCALRWYNVDLNPERAMAWIRRGITQDEMTFAGDGARGIVAASRGEGGVGHVFNVVNQGGSIRFLDGQSGGEASFDGGSLGPYVGFELMITHP